MRITEYGMMLEHDELRPSGSIGWHTMISWCHCHNKFEEVKPDFHVVCFECGHVYNTAAELVEAYNEVVSQMNAEPFDNLAGPDDGETPFAQGRVLTPLKTVDQVDTIFFCQECLHDF